MKNTEFRESLYADFGGFLLPEEPSSYVVLKLSHTSIVYCPSEEKPEPGSMYPRAIELMHGNNDRGVLLATFECYVNDEPVFPIYRSENQGRSWSLVGNIEDKESHFGCRYQPHLYEVPCTCGELSAGTILCAGNIIPKDNSSTSLRLYKSVDSGKSWKYISEIIAGGKAEVDIKEDVERPVWEPFLISDGNGCLYCFYSDEKYAKTKNYNQALFHKKSFDGGKTWSKPVTDVAFSDGILRPGMPVISKIGSNKYIMVYEMVNQEGVPVYFRISDSLDDWGEVDFIGNPVRCVDGSYISGTPYVTWIPSDNENGTILVSGRGFSHVVANSHGGSGFWEKMEQLLLVDNQYWFSGYSQCLVPICEGKKILNLSPVNCSNKKAMIQAAVANVFIKR